MVCSALDKKTNQKVAIKKVPNAFDDLIDAKRIVREIRLLSKNAVYELFLKLWIGFFDHENIISLVDVIKPEARTGFNDIYIVTDLMETDLHRVIYSRQVKKNTLLPLILTYNSGPYRWTYTIFRLPTPQRSPLHAQC